MRQEPTTADLRISKQASNRHFTMPEPKQEAPFDAAGPLCAPTIILLHGSSETRRMWQPQAQALSDSFRVIAADLPAHGALAALAFRMEDTVEWLAELVGRETRGPAVLVGISLGGYVAMEFAARYPEKAAGLVLLSCTGEPTSVGAALYWAGTWVMSVAPIAWLAALKRSLARILYSPDLSYLLTGYFFRGGAQGIREVLWKSYIEKVRSYPGPILFINGSRDLPFRTSERRFLAAAPQGRLEVVPRAYHVCNLDDPARVTSAIRGFAESLSSVRA
jgi:pimeloyl-ACP methyl ester carboxylesterase